MRCEPGDDVAPGVVAFDQQSFVGAHLGEIEPMVGGIVVHHQDLAPAVAIDHVGGDHVVRPNAAAVAHRQRSVDHRPLDRPPDVDEGEPPGQQGLGLVAHQVADALRAGGFGVVAMRAHHREPRHAWRPVGNVRSPDPQGVVEHHHP